MTAERENDHRVKIIHELVAFRHQEQLPLPLPLPLPFSAAYEGNMSKTQGSAHVELEKHPTVDESGAASGLSSSAAAVDYAGAKDKTDPEEIKLVRKLDIWITPTLFVMFFLNYLDRNALALSILDGIKKELDLDQSKYETCVSILYVGYLLGQVPSNVRKPQPETNVYAEDRADDFDESAPLALRTWLYGALGCC